MQPDNTHVAKTSLVHRSVVLLLFAAQRLPTPAQLLPAEAQTSKSYKEMPHPSKADQSYSNSILIQIKRYPLNILLFK
jgi:hypothetical protein